MFTILYVDDEPTLLDVGKIFLQNSGSFTVVTALSAHEALEKLKTVPVDCIVSDYQMPGMNGIELLKDLRNGENQVPFILFTGRGREEIVIEAINNGADYYLQKGGEPTAQFAELSHKIRLAIEHSRTMTALFESEEKYRSLVSLAPLAVIVHQNGRIAYANPESVRVTGGITAEDLAGRELLPFIHPDDRAVALERFRLLSNGATIPLTETRLIRIDGRIITVEAAGKQILYGGIPAVMIVFRDITGRKKRDDELRAAYEQIAASEEELRSQYEELARVERQVRESRERLRAFMDSATDSFSIWDAGLSLVDLNTAALAHLPPGTKKEDLIGRNLQEFLSGTGEWVDPQRYLDVIRTGIPLNGTVVRMDPLHGRQWLNVKCFRVGDGLGIATGDITKEKEAADEIRASEKKFRDILEKMQDAYFMTNENGTISMVNPSAVRMFGYRSAGEITGQPAAFAYLHHGDRDTLLRILGDSSEITNFSTVMVRRDGTTFPASLNIQVIRDEDGKVKGTEGIVRDMSEKN